MPQAAPPRLTVPSPGQAGFTLLELIVVMALSALLLGLAAPAMDGLVARQRLRSASYDLVTDLTLARSESLKRAALVRLEPITAGDWQSGWRLTDASGGLLAQRNPLGGAVQVTEAPAEVVFDSRGMVDAADPVRFALNDGHDSRRCILLDPSGRPRSVPAACPP